MPSPNRPNLSIAIPEPKGEFQRPVRGPVQGTSRPSRSTRAPSLPRDPFVVEDSMEDIPLEELGPPPPYSNSRRAAPPTKPHPYRGDAVPYRGTALKPHEINMWKVGRDVENKLELPKPLSAWRKALGVTFVLLGVGGVVAISVYESHRSGTQVK